mmetsp:Transcript_20684/g.43284  ORF Transcript_20684/g.43284 Transcript_20684/m.43284 type:complete len:475 (-) Transcript_20684:111-1535(-)|eukprot:CAMPEP_0118633752 /NCGR_PEP_ID=MMETSP0785-20121206/1168_1 /TAXON_ID=91992 /ORGANISM="Bolidomonas pacifica, Strain CCMP 1866" /LENGTH=474 /DNA_ID=CAMNT_0006524655 /DNA_START=106 /DNA_END=1530 /DNA_ORIENTATION=+
MASQVVGLTSSNSVGLLEMTTDVITEGEIEVVRLEIKNPEGDQSDEGQNIFLYGDWRRVRQRIKEIGVIKPNAMVHLIISTPKVHALGKLSMKNSTNMYGLELFAELENVWKVSLPHIVEVGNKAFDHCRSLVEVDCPNAKRIGGGSFANCPNLVKANVRKVERIGVRAFEICTRLKELYMPEVIEIGMRACFNCESLFWVYCPKAYLLGFSMFSKCVNLRHISINPNLGSSASQTCFEECYTLNVIVRAQNPLNAREWFKPYISAMKAGTGYSRDFMMRGYETYKTDHSKLVFDYLDKTSREDEDKKEAYFQLVICLKLCSTTNKKTMQPRAIPNCPIMKVLTGPGQDVARRVVEYKYGVPGKRKNKGELRWKDLWEIRNMALDDHLLYQPENKENFKFWGVQVGFEGQILGPIRKRKHLVHFNMLSELDIDNCVPPKSKKCRFTTRVDDKNKPNPSLFEDKKPTTKPSIPLT